ncbi:MAG: methyl-accepting chemotaxis protein [Treponema sp.]|nr:methyl-accepting chemotaxis protein [Treponema sp.]
MKIRDKMFCGFAAIAIVGISLGLIGLAGERRLTAGSGDIRDAAELGSSLAGILASHHLWRQDMSDAVYRGLPFHGSLDPTACALGKWLIGEEAKAVDDPELLVLLRSIIEPHDRIHTAGKNIVDQIARGNTQAAEDYFERTILPEATFVIDGLEKMGERNAAMLNDMTRDVFDFGKRFGLIISIMIAVALLVSVILALLITGIIVRPIREVTGTLKDISEGEGDLTRNINAASRDEIGDLSRYFNLTIKKIRELVVNIRSEAEKLSDIGTTLAGNTSETAAAINEITANIGSIKTRIINQSASITETNATMEQVTTNIDKLNGHIENQAGHVVRTSAAIEEMVASIHAVTETLVRNSGSVLTLKEASEVGRAGLQDVNTDIREIARESEGLMEINSVMENIASQTNLLSMNAAIEAAHAGEAGRGFAVVADEIRKLAENSSEQSKTIGSVLKKMKDSVDKITRSTENVLDKFEAIDSNVGLVAEQGTNIRSAMEEQESGSRQELDSIMQVNDTTRQVKTGSGEMLIGAKEVIAESSNLEKSTQEITCGISEMAAGAEQINIAVNQVNQISIENRKSIQALLQEVSRFKVG